MDHNPSHNSQVDSINIDSVELCRCGKERPAEERRRENMRVHKVNEAKPNGVGISSTGSRDLKTNAGVPAETAPKARTGTRNKRSDGICAGWFSSFSASGPESNRVSHAPREGDFR